MAQIARREFVFQDAKSHKFWAIELDGTSHTVHYGRVGTNGQTKTKDFDSDADAKASYEKLIGQKTKKGYVASGDAPAATDDASNAATKKAAPAKKKAAPAKKKATKKATTKKATTKKAGAPAAEPQKAGAPAAEPKKAAAPSAPVDRAKTLGLGPKQLVAAAWRKLEALERPEPRPYDHDACVQTLRKLKTSTYGWEWPWDAAIPDVVTHEEASFWLTAMAKAERSVKPAEVADELKKAPRLVTAKTAARLFLKSQGRHVHGLTMAGGTRAPAALISCLATIFEPAALIDFLEGVGASPGTEADWFEGLRLRLIPYLSPQERAALSAGSREKVTPANWPLDFYSGAPLAFYLCALTGGAEAELLAVVESWADDLYKGQDGWHTDHYQQPQRVICGLASPALMLHHFERLNLPLRTPQHLGMFLACADFAGLDWAAKSVGLVANKEEAAALMAVLERVRAPELAPGMLDLLGSKAPKQAKVWLREHPAQAAFGLVELAGSGTSKRAQQALDVLKDLKRAGHSELLVEAAASASEGAAARVRAEVIEKAEVVIEPFGDDAPAWVKEGAAAARAIKKVKAPTWIVAADLPPVIVGERRLSDEQVQALFLALQKAPSEGALGPEFALISGLREHGDRAALGRWCWALFQDWLTEGAPSKEKWALAAMGHLGDDHCALQLAPLVRTWPGESQHKRAVLGLDVLRGIGTDTALMQINGIATKLKYKALKTRGRECMEAIAKARGMSRAELEDRIVPDLDLDPQGQRVFDYGPRQFSFALGPDLKPMVRDGAGKLRANPPKPAAKDDAALAKAAQDDWKLFKKQLREILKIQPARLEQAMVTGRRWPLEQFKQLLVEHPLMTHLVRLVLWGDYVGTKAPVPFRVSVERELLDQDDEPYAPKGEVGIVHPFQLSEGVRQAWGEVFGDYEIVAPFSQLGREIYSLTPKEKKARAITRIKDKEIGATTLMSAFERLGWTRGEPQDAGIVAEHLKQFPGAGFTAIASYEDGVPVGYLQDWDDQRVTHVIFQEGLKNPSDCAWASAKDGVPLAQIDEITLSEVLRDLEALAGKAR